MTLRLSETLGHALQMKEYTIAVAESCTGGGIASAITESAGSSQWFSMGIVSYSDVGKQSLLGVNPETLRKHGSVSEDVVREMLTGILKLSGASIGIAVSGIAGPTGGSPHKPVGTVCVAWGDDSIQYSNTYLFSGSRSEVRSAATKQSLHLASRFLKDQKP